MKKRDVVTKVLPEVKAWREFSEKVERRLSEKNAEGYAGWDGGYCTRALLAEIKGDSLAIEMDNGCKKLCLDIAARSMMIERRINK